MLGNLNPMLKFDFLFRNIEKKTQKKIRKKKSIKFGIGNSGILRLSPRFGPFFGTKECINNVGSNG